MAQKLVQGSDWLKSVNANFTELFAASLTTLATLAEALAGSVTDKAVTPAGLENAIGFTDVWTFVGRNGAGACTLTGAKVGDKVLSVAGLVLDTGNKASKFEAVITVANQIQQTDAGDLSLNNYLVFLYRKS